VHVETDKKSQQNERVKSHLSKSDALDSNKTPKNMIKVFILPFTNFCKLWSTLPSPLPCLGASFQCLTDVSFLRLRHRRRENRRLRSCWVPLQILAKMFRTGMGFGLSALLRGSSRPFKVCNTSYASLHYRAVHVKQKLFCGDQSQIFLLSCAIARFALLEQIVCIIINLEFKPKF